MAVRGGPLGITMLPIHLRGPSLTTTLIGTLLEEPTILAFITHRGRYHVVPLLVNFKVRRHRQL